LLHQAQTGVVDANIGTVKLRLQVFVQDLPQDLVFTCEHNLGIEIFSVTRHIDDIFIKFDFLLAIRYLVHGAIKDKDDAVGLLLQVVLGRLLDV